MCSFPVLRYFLGLLCTMGISACEKQINKKDETQNVAENGQLELFFWTKITKKSKTKLIIYTMKISKKIQVLVFKCVNLVIFVQK